VANPSILCLGEILFDCLADQPGRSLEEVESWTAYPGGAPANVACCLTKLGSSAGFIGCIGQDQSGRELRQLLESLGVDCSGIQEHPTAPTRKVYVLRSPTGDRSFAGFGDQATDQFADAFLDARKLPEVLWQDADFLVLGTLELAYPQTREAIFQALEWANLYDLKVVLDVNWRPMFWHNPDEARDLIKQLYHRIDFLKVSDDEAQWLFNTKDAGAIAHRLDTVEGVIVTAGDQQVSYCLNSHEGKVIPPSVVVQDTTGSGDAFLGGLIHQLHQKGLTSLNDPDSVRDLIQYACVVGSLTATKPGAIAAQPTPSEIAQVFSELAPSKKVTGGERQKAKGKRQND
jgi:fructokinase